MLTDHISVSNDVQVPSAIPLPGRRRFSSCKDASRVHRSAVFYHLFCCASRLDSFQARHDPILASSSPSAQKQLVPFSVDGVGFFGDAVYCDS